MKKKILICGTSGFIGKNIFETLSKRDDINVWGADIVRPLKPNPRLILADLRDKEWVKTVVGDKDIVIHAAAVTAGADAVKSNPERYVADNIIMNTNITDAVHMSSVSHFIFLSCTVMYQDSIRPLLEEEYDLSLILPEYFMGARIKVNMEDLCYFYTRNSKTIFTVVRPSSVYGPHDKFDLVQGHIFDSMIKRVADAPNGSTIPIQGLGDGMRDFVHVSDLIRFIELIIDRPSSYRFNIFNVGSGVSVSIKELAQKMIGVSGKNLSVFCDRTQHNLANRLWIDIRKAKALGWQPFIDLEDGIRQTMEWYKVNRTEKNDAL